ncbi:MAG: hypothetical protein HRU14_17545, partial [Planctomycetes bacterium]|nr:hypothetical protein [Planctomycetota bacterium]
MSTGVPQPIRQVIGRFRLRLRLLRATVGLGVTLLVWSLVLGTALGLDRWLVLPVIWRTMITAGAVTIGLVAAIVLILVPVLRPLRRLALAKAIESAAPALEEGLLTVCELAALPPAQSDSPELVAALQSDTVDRVRAVSVGDLVDLTPARRALTVGVTAALVLVVVALLEPTGFRQLLERFARPADASLPRPTTVVIDVRPGGFVIGKGARVEVTAAPVQGRPGVAFIWWRFPGGDWHREMMREASTRSPVEGGSIFRYVLRDVERDFEYRVRGGDFLSPVHLVQVRERPAPTGFRMTYRYPDYTGKAPETVAAELGNVAAVVGTEVDVEVQVDRDLVRASIRIEGEDVEPRDVEVVGASCRFHVTLRKTTRYHLLLEDPEGVTSVAGGPFSLEAMQDRPPLLRIIRPRATRTAVEPGRSLGVHVEARDDFGVESITIAAARPDGAPQSFTIPLDVEDRTAFAVKYRWDVSRLGLGPGESARFRIVVRDGSGTVTRGPPSSVEVAFLPDPPEGGEWFSRLDEIQREFKHAMEEWSHLLGGTGDPSARLMVADRARAEFLGEVSGETLRHLDQWRQLAGRCDATGDAVAIPSIHRRGLAALADRLRECARSEGMTFWRATL